MRFIALMTPAIQSMVKGSAKSPSWMAGAEGLAMLVDPVAGPVHAGGHRELDQRT